MYKKKSYIDALLKDKGAKFINDKVELWLNFDCKLDNYGEFYAGAITSLLIEKKEFLDPVNAELPFMYMFHDREKRCMQIDTIQLFSPNDQLNLPISLFNSSYEYHSHYREDDMVSMIILSCPIYSNNRIFRLKRKISLPDNSSCLIEEVTLIGDNVSLEEIPDFSLSYYSHVHSRLEPLKMYVNDNLKNGFIMSYEQSIPKVFYQFYSNVVIDERPEERINSFSWRLSKTKKVINVHSFARESVYLPFIGSDFDEFPCAKKIIFEEA